MSRFDTVAASQTLAPIDVHFGRLIRRAASAEARVDSDLLALTAVLLSRQRGRGHSCIDPRDWAGRPFPTDGLSALPALPELGDWQQALTASSLVGDGSQPTPLVRDDAGRLYLRRYWRAERRLVRHVQQRLASPGSAIDPEGLAPLFSNLFGLGSRNEARGSDTEVDWQAVAAAVTLCRGVTLITGGPGTGKTTTVIRILALLTGADEDRRITLAAPTGKAAARLGEAIAEQIDSLPIGAEHRERLPRQASTLHRLLGFDPRRDRFRHRAGRPLALDTLVIDEASMVDLLMMDAVFDALPAGAQVILLGDRDQLASVETGFVFGDLCAAVNPDGTYSTEVVDLFRRLGGGEIELRPSASPPSDALRDAAVELRVSYRFRDHPGIGELAGAVRKRQAVRALQMLDDAAFPDVVRLEPPAVPKACLEPLHSALDYYLASDSPAQALERLGRFRILCARRQGDWGVERLNALVERHLAKRGYRVTERWYPARPVMVTANNYQVRLFNGDLGVCWPEDERLWAWFESDSGLRRLPLAKLPPHETAWAMTVHKSQGSEFDKVLLALGATDSQVMTRELLYTGVTRARQNATIVATPEILRLAILRAVRRASGLADALQPQAATKATGSAVPTTDPEDATETASDSGQLSLF